MAYLLLGFRTPSNSRLLLIVPFEAWKCNEKENATECKQNKNKLRLQNGGHLV